MTIENTKHQAHVDDIDNMEEELKGNGFDMETITNTDGVDIHLWFNGRKLLNAIIYQCDENEMVTYYTFKKGVN